MTTSDVVALLRRELPDDVSVVCSLGRLAEVAFHHFPLQTLFLDCMGDVAPLACGIALGLPNRPILALDSDGSHLFGLAGLPTIAALQERLGNLLLVVFDNQIYESAGGLPSRSCAVLWPQLGQAFELEIVYANTEEVLHKALAGAFRGLRYIVAAIHDSDASPPAVKTVDGIESRYLFIRHLERVTGLKLLHPAIKS